MATKYVSKALIPCGEDSQEGDQGPFYRYFKAESLEEAAEIAFQNRHALYAGGSGAGIFGNVIAYLGLESVYALAVKEVGRQHKWQVILDMQGEFLNKKGTHQRYDLASALRKYGAKTFKDRTEYVFERLGIRKPSTS